MNDLDEETTKMIAEWTLKYIDRVDTIIKSLIINHPQVMQNTGVKTPSASVTRRAIASALPPE